MEKGKKRWRGGNPGKWTFDPIPFEPGTIEPGMFEPRTNDPHQRHQVGGCRQSARGQDAMLYHEGVPALQVTLCL